MTGFVDFASLRRPRTPNTYLVAPDGLCETARTDAVSPLFEMSPDELFNKVMTLVEAAPRWTLSDSQPDTRQLAFVARTRLLAFRDDVDIAVLPVGNDDRQSTLAIYSRSRLGKSDLGANRKRVVGFLDKLTAK